MHRITQFDREEFLDRIMVKLGSIPIDFYETFSTVRESANSPSPSLAAGVMLPVYFCQKNSAALNIGDDVFFRLIKRSRRVSQAGDLACPGGILHERLDAFLMKLITNGIIPILRNKAGRLARKRDALSYRTITLFLANAVREAWEEISINPFHVHYLGALPPYSLSRHRRTIFPLVCYIDKQTAVNMNHEVEYILDIPVAAFFDEENYASLRVDADANIPGEPREVLPCMIYKDEKRGENILWGATFFIVMSFLQIICDFELPRWEDRRIVRKSLDSRYISGVK